jgi:hypothetical protein
VAVFGKQSNNEISGSIKMDYFISTEQQLAYDGLCSK